MSKHVDARSYEVNACYQNLSARILCIVCMYSGDALNFHVSKLNIFARHIKNPIKNGRVDIELRSLK